MDRIISIYYNSGTKSYGLFEPPDDRSPKYTTVFSGFSSTFVQIKRKGGNFFLDFPTNTHEYDRRFEPVDIAVASNIRAIYASAVHGINLGLWHFIILIPDDIKVYK